MSVVVRDRPQLAGKPVAVCHSEKVNGTAEISSSNYAARKFGLYLLVLTPCFPLYFGYFEVSQ